MQQLHRKSLALIGIREVMGFPGGSDSEESACNVEDLGSIPGLGRSLGEGNGYLLQYSGLENLGSRVKTQLSNRTEQIFF